MNKHRLVAGLATTVLAVAGCSATGGTDKAGGGDAPVTLTMIDVAANLNAFPAVQYFIDDLAKVSGGKLIIDVEFNRTDFAPDAEQQIVHDVADGEADLARIGTRAFDRLGVPDFQALTAPMIINNYPLQAAVFDRGIPTQMLAGLEPLGLTGLGVLAGPLRRPVGTKPLVARADWRDLTIGIRASDGEVAAVTALGATPTEVVGPPLDRALASHEIDGLVTDMLQFDQNDRENTTPYVTANVALWPQTLALIVNSDRLAKLTDEQRGWLQRATQDAAAYSLQVADQDPTLLAKVCEEGARFADATPAQLEELQQAFMPVYLDLERDPLTDAYFDQIVELKQQTYSGLGLPIPKACSGPAPIREGVNADPEATSALNGTYRYTLTVDDARTWPAEHGLPPETDEAMKAYPNTNTLTLEDGTWTSSESSFPDQPGHGTYAVSGNMLTWYWSEGGQASFTFTVDADGTLRFTEVPGNPEPGFIFVAEPWTKIR